MAQLSFTLYFDKNHKVKRIVAHAEWCDYNCSRCNDADFCEKIYNAIAEVTGYFVKEVQND